MARRRSNAQIDRLQTLNRRTQNWGLALAAGEWIAAKLCLHLHETRLTLVDVRYYWHSTCRDRHTPCSMDRHYLTWDLLYKLAHPVKGPLTTDGVSIATYRFEFAVCFCTTRNGGFSVDNPEDCLDLDCDVTG
jgi:hypothetical protein